VKQQQKLIPTWCDNEMGLADRGYQGEFLFVSVSFSVKT
jgi:hypothetical protein